MGCRTRGFSLIEVLVAFTLLALALGAIYPIFGAGLRAAERGGEYARAVQHARSVLSGLALEADLGPGSAEGTFDDGYRWRTEIADYIAPDQAAEPPATPLFAVRIEIAWGEGRSAGRVSLDTVKIARP